MARSHHRKKHKEHLRQFRHNQDVSSSRSGKVKATGLFTVIGAALGFAVSYFAANGSMTWIIVAVIVGAIGGYYIGRNIDREKI